RQNGISIIERRFKNCSSKWSIIFSFQYFILNSYYILS
ncbi:LOW QUALITY PROTEIN: hypothetical protein TorRG33x02_219440, partial [Trema orientale]